MGIFHTIVEFSLRWCRLMYSRWAPDLAPACARPRRGSEAVAAAHSLALRLRDAAQRRCNRRWWGHVGGNMCVCVCVYKGDWAGGKGYQ